MKRILIHIPVEKHGEYDIFSESDNEAFVGIIKEKCNHICPNVGNRLWFQGIISAIQSPENQLEYYSFSMSKDYINENYDLIVAPMANIFSVGFTALQETLAERFHGIKIPVYVIACGVQASDYDQLAEISRQLKHTASKFISSVYDTGGEFALRGYFTKEFFDRLGFHSAVVTGCPSLYQLGRNLHISEEKVSKDSFLPLFNGIPRNYTRLLKEYPNSVFVDQDIFWRELLDPTYFDDQVSDKEWLKQFVKRYGFDVTQYLLQDRIKLIPGMNTWREFIRSNHFNCSYGSRIHGNIMPILSGIPSILECRDARTREMAEFYGIPCVTPAEFTQYDSLYDLYLSIDYGKFNSHFREHFDYYESFLKTCGIIDKINENNTFFRGPEKEEHLAANLEKRTHLLSVLTDQHSYWRGYSNLIDVKRKIASALIRE